MFLHLSKCPFLTLSSLSACQQSQSSFAPFLRFIKRTEEESTLDLFIVLFITAIAHMSALPSLSAKAAKKRLPTAEKKDDMHIYLADLEHERQKALRPKKAIYRAGNAPDWAGDASDDEDLTIRARRQAKKETHHEVDSLPSEFKRRATIKAEVVVGDTAMKQEPKQEEVAQDEENEVKEAAAPPKYIDVTKLEVPKALEETEADDTAIEDRRARARLKAKARREAEEAEAAKVQDQPEEEDEEEEDSEESESEDEYVSLSRPMLKPTFVSKSQRATIEERDKLEAEEAAIEEAKEIAKEERKIQTQKLVETLKMEDELKLAKQADGAGSDNEDLPATDDEDEDALLSAWKLRELQRIKRDQEQRDEFAKEAKEIERRRNMTDAEIAEENKRLGLKKGGDRGQMRFLQKYYHPGAFYQGAYDDVQKRDFTEATGEDRHVDRTLLPKVLQVKKFGLKGRTKYTHLVDQDTTRKEENIFLASERDAGTVSKHKLAGTGALDTTLTKKRRTDTA
eukprot:g44084.t1